MCLFLWNLFIFRVPHTRFYFNILNFYGALISDVFNDFFFQKIVVIGLFSFFTKQPKLWGLSNLHTENIHFSVYMHFFVSIKKKKIFIIWKKIVFKTIKVQYLYVTDLKQHYHHLKNVTRSFNDVWAWRTQ